MTIARSLRHIEKYYDIAAIGQFSERLKPISRTDEVRPEHIRKADKSCPADDLLRNRQMDRRGGTAG